MRKRVIMTFLRGKNVKGFMGHWSMNYYVENIIDLENNELICSEYTFENSTIYLYNITILFSQKMDVEHRKEIVILLCFQQDSTAKMKMMGQGCKTANFRLHMPFCIRILQEQKETG